MSSESLNPWKLATIGILLVGATVAATMLVTGQDSRTESPDSETAQASEALAPVTEKKAAQTVKAVPVERQQSARAASTHPSQSIMEACNKYANEQVDSRAEEVLTNAALGAAIGAAVGAAGGAIAGGGSGAGKGAAIGGITGAAGGSLYGLNESKSHDAEYQAAYSSCMRSKGY